jgi:heterodisulfide reductase subunit A
VLATGFTHFDSINKPEWGFGTFEDVVTTTQVEQMVAAGKIACPSDGRTPERVCILLCVGSRDRQIGREWCSKICCTVSANLAMEIKELSPKTDVYIYYMDIRTFGLYEDKYYWRSQEEFRTKFVKARIAEVTRGADGRLLVKGEDTLVKRPIVIPFDLVVHAIGMDPNLDNPEIAKVFGVGLEKHGFLDRAEHYTSSFASTRRGIYVGGAALGPEDIDTCISHGLAMAMRVVGDLSAPARAAA